MKHGTPHTYDYHKCRCRPCKDAHNAKNKRHRKPRTELQREKARAWATKRRTEIKAWLLETVGSVCVRCGTDENIEFDHIDPETKLFNPSQTISWEKIQAEAPKLQALCHSCHIKKTDENGDRNRWREVVS